MTAMNQQLQCIRGLLEILGALPKKKFWFRGHRCQEWKLQPSIFRDPFQLSHESTLSSRFRQNAAQFLPQIPKTEWDWLFLMQHHLLPTRLLDWSENPLVGLYFCVENIDDTSDGAIWILDPVGKNRKIANHKARVDYEIPFFGEAVDNLLTNYSPTKMIQEETTSLPPLSAIAVRFSSRMHAQQGAFTIFHREEKPLEEYTDSSSFLTKYIVPGSAKPALRKELGLLGIHKLSIFPDLDSVASYAKEQIS
jgi:hypothetical protein